MSVLVKDDHLERAPEEGESEMKREKEEATKETGYVDEAEAELQRVLMSHHAALHPGHWTIMLGSIGQL